MGRALLNKALIQLSADGWGCTSLGSCLAWGNPALGPRGSMIGLMANSRRVYAKGDLPGPPSPWWAPADPHLHRRPCNTSREFWFTLPWGHCSSLWVLVRAKFCLCPPRLESLFPSVLWEACDQTPLALKARFPRGSQALCRGPRPGSLMWGSEPSQQCENFFGIIVLQSVGHPPSGYGFDFIVIAPLPPSHCGFLFVFEHGVHFFGGVQRAPVMVAQRLVAISVLLQEEMRTRPTPPSWTGSPSLWVELLSFLSLSYQISLYTLDINLLSNIQLADNFSPFCGLFFHSPDSVHWGTNILKFDEIQLSIVLFCCLGIWCHI